MIGRTLRFLWWLFVLNPIELWLLMKLQKRPRVGEVLLVRLDGMGDFILWLDAAKAIRQLYPRGDYTITLLAHHTVAPIARELPCFDRVWSVDRTPFLLNPLYRYRTLKHVRESCFEKVIHATYSREFDLGDAVVRVSGARERIGSVGCRHRMTPYQRAISDRWYTSLIPATPGTLHEVERNAEFVRGLGMVCFDAALPKLPPSKRRLPGSPSSRYYILFPGARFSFRQWPLSRFAELARRIHARTGWRGVVCGGPGEQSLGDCLVRQAGVPLGNWAGRTSSAELVQLIAAACLVISNETSAIHIAPAVAVPSVCILGGGHFGRFIPYPENLAERSVRPIPVFQWMECFGCNWNCLVKVRPGKPNPCLEKVTTDIVWRAVKKILDGIPLEHEGHGNSSRTRT